MYDSARHHRRSLRLKGYDYSQPGLYFVTLCTHDKEALFGEVVNEAMRLNAAGQAVRACWYQLSRRFPTVQLDAFVVMPNHIHGVLVFLRPLPMQAPKSIRHAQKGAASSAPTSEITLGRVIRAFKSLSAREVNHLLRRRDQPLWQRNYYEHIIRAGEDLDEIRRYIIENPMRWSQDPENRALQSTRD